MIVTATNTDIDGLRFVAKVLPKTKDDKRFHVNHIMVRPYFFELQAWTTDGSRCHIFNLVGDIAPGFYQVVKNTKKDFQMVLVRELDDESFPKIEEYFPNGCAVEVGLPFYNTSMDLSVGYTALVRVTDPDADQVFSFDFFKDVMQGGVDMLEYYGKDKPLIGRGSRVTALLMPFSV